MTGAELQALRRAAGLNQACMGAMVSATRHTISYWECKGLLSRNALRWGIPSKMLQVMGHPLPDYRTSTRARGDGVLVWTDAEQAALDRETARIMDKLAAQTARYRQPCGAKTRKGHPCCNMSEPGRRRCKFHGGKSTGPKTPEGRARIAEAQRKRWAIHRDQMSRAV